MCIAELLGCPTCSNYRTWVLLACYGFSFGVELTVDNNLAPYLQSEFGKSITAAGNLASIFGLLNFFSRPCGQHLLPDRTPQQHT